MRPTLTLLARHLFLYVLFCLCVTQVGAQVGSTYNFTSNTLSPVNPLSGATALDVIEADDVHGPAINIGFTFNFDGVNYTQVRANSNGWLGFDVSDAPTVAEMTTNDLANSAASTRPCIAALWDDLGVGALFSGTQFSTAQYRTTGVAPNRVFTFEWQNWKWDKNAVSVSLVLNQFTAQAKLYETTNVIEIVYSVGSGAVNNGSGGASIGIAGAATGAGNFLSLGSVAATPVASSTVATNNLGPARPAEGQIYRFTPINYANGACSSPVPFAIPNATNANTKGCASLGININGLPTALGAGPGQALFSNIELVIAHPQRMDIDMTLTSPSGQTFNMILDRGGIGDNFGIPGTCPPATVFRLQDGGALLSSFGDTPNNITGTFSPEQPLSGFTGNPNGVWVLNIYDDAQLAGSVGSVQYVKLNIAGSSPPDCLGVPGGTALPGTPCNDGNACTINDVYTGTAPTCGCAGTFQDTDGDGVCNANDVCPGGDDALDADGDGVPNFCDICAGGDDALDADGDGVPNFCDICPGGDDNLDADGDGVPNFCDICPGGDDALDVDGDGVPNFCDICPGGDDNLDTDGDGDANACDNCVSASNPTQTNSDGDPLGDACDVCPTVTNGNPGDPCNDGNPNTVLDVRGASPACSCAGVTCTANGFFVVDNADGAGLRWSIRQQGSNTLVASSFFYPGYFYYPPTAQYSDPFCLPDGCYYLTVEDEDGNGITTGGYKLLVAGKRVIDNAGNFLNGAVSAIAGQQGFCVVGGTIGTDRLIWSSLDREDWRTAPCTPDVIWTNNTGAARYRFWFYDPNGGASFYGPTASGGTSNSLSLGAVPVINGVLYNVRVQTKATTTSPWSNAGPASRLRVDNTLAQCRKSKLYDDPSFPSKVSCGAVKPLLTGTQANSTNQVWARPITRVNANCVEVDANKYQFRFRLPAENIAFIVNATGSNSWVFLNAATNAAATQCSGAYKLLPCKTYEVEVRGSFDGGLTWCHGGTNACDVNSKWGDVCLLTTTGCATGGGQNMLTDPSTSEGASDLRMYPNPNRGDQLYIGLERIAEEVNTVSVDIYDTFGRRVSARTIAVQDGFINTVLELNGELAAGMYTVNIIAGEVQYMERLVSKP